MKGKKVKERVNVTVTDEVKSYYIDKAEEMGVSMSAVMFMALYQQMDQEKGLKAMGMGDFTGMLSKINEKLDKGDK